MGFFWFVFAGLAALIAVLSLVDLVRHRDRYHGAAVPAWILLILIVPFIGSVIYWARRKPSTEDAEQARLAQEDIRREAARRSTDTTSIHP